MQFRGERGTLISWTRFFYITISRAEMTLSTNEEGKQKNKGTYIIL